MTTRRLLLAAAVGVLGVALLAAALRGQTRSYSPDEVARAFAQQGFALTEPPRYVRDPDGGGVVISPVAGRSEGTFLVPPSGDFYVFVARSDAFAKKFFAPYQVGGDPRTFDHLQGNVVVSSDASQTQVGLTMSQRRRIRAAMASLDDRQRLMLR